MKKQNISKDYLIEIAQKIVMDEGLTALSIRRVATDADVAIGSVYNYFTSKADLTYEVISSMWDTMFISDISTVFKTNNYVKILEESYNHIAFRAETYHTIFAGYYQSLTPEERNRNRDMHRNHFAKISSVFLKGLDGDPNVNHTIWNEKFTKKEYNQFVVRNLFESLRHEQKDIHFLLELVKLTLYKE